MFKKIMIKNSLTIIKRALAEDKVKRDITTNSLIPKEAKTSAVIYFKQAGVVCGLDLAKDIFRLLDRNLNFKTRFKDGDKIRTATVVARLKGKARAILSAERVALNFLGHLSGIATLTKAFVDKVRPFRVKIVDTRKTLPNLRILQKYAVLCGGGANHRGDLDEMVMIKDNHKKFISDKTGVGGLVRKARNRIRNKNIEIEVENLTEYQQALAARPNIIMLDNMRISDIKKAVKIKTANSAFHSVLLEVSGKVRLKNVRQIAKSGVDMISIGELTHSAPSVDVSLEIND